MVNKIKITKYNYYPMYQIIEGRLDDTISKLTEIKNEILKKFPEISSTDISIDYSVRDHDKDIIIEVRRLETQEEFENRINEETKRRNLEEEKERKILADLIKKYPSLVPKSND
jgi:uncharacterized protein YqgV (UPF0045/DUF77 family)